MPRFKDNNHMARKRPFLWISKKGGRVTVATETFKTGYIQIPATAVRWMKNCQYCDKQQSINQSILYVGGKTILLWVSKCMSVETLSCNNMGRCVDYIYLCLTLNFDLHINFMFSPLILVWHDTCAL